MAARPVATFLALALTLVGGACGGTTTVTPRDVGVDVTPHDAGGDVAVDGGRDGPTDGALPDGGDAGPTSVPRFLSETSGGARLVSPSYRLELFVGPARPVGATTSPNYHLKLGPGALRNAR